MLKQFRRKTKKQKMRAEAVDAMTRVKAQADFEIQILVSSLVFATEAYYGKMLPKELYDAITSGVMGERWDDPTALRAEIHEIVKGFKEQEETK